MVRILIAVDTDTSTERAFHEAMKSYNQERDKLYLCAMYVVCPLSICMLVSMYLYLSHASWPIYYKFFSISTIFFFSLCSFFLFFRSTLCNVSRRTSNWDYLNTEKNAARLELYKFESWCDSSKVCLDHILS